MSGLKEKTHVCFVVGFFSFFLCWCIFCAGNCTFRSFSILFSIEAKIF